MGLDNNLSARIERLVCSGGGAKGVVYPGSYKAVEETGVLKGIKEFAGASAGAITVALIAVGMTTSHFRTVLLTTNLEELMGDNVGAVFGSNVAGVCFLTKDGKPLEQFIRKHIIETVRATLDNLEDVDLIASQYPAFNALLIKLQGEQPRFTFGDLAILNQHFSDKFKQLIIPAVTFPNGDIQIFNAERTPDVEIALACRASASIPVILEPVEIEIGSKKQKFVDAGFYDNFPTDYFDVDKSGVFIKNQKPKQTMVFAFGEGLDNKKNQVFQALYGERWDEVISEKLLGEIIDEGMKLAHKFLDLEEEDELDAPDDESQLLIHAVTLLLKERVRAGSMGAEVARVIIHTMKTATDSILLEPESNQEFWQAYKHERSEEAQVKLLGKLVKEKMRPILSDASMIDKFKCNVLVGMLGDLSTPYTHTARHEEGYQRLRTEYALRTVELRVGNLKTTDFNEATKSARIMDAFGYLDTMNHITNHDLHDPEQFNPDKFYLNLVHYFERLYEAVLHGSGKDPKLDPLIKDIALLSKQLEVLGKSRAVISRQVYHLVKDRAEGGLESVEAFALSRAVEFHNKTLRADDLFKETYEEGFKRSSIFSFSDITGERFFRVTPLHESLKEKNMFDLYKRKFTHNEKTRTELVFGSLRDIEAFYDAYEQCIQEKEKYAQTSV